MDLTRISSIINKQNQLNGSIFNKNAMQS